MEQDGWRDESRRQDGDAPARRGGRAARTGALTGALGFAALLAFGLSVSISAPALAEVSARCRVPDVYVALPADLKRTERLIDRERPVRLLVLGPSIGGPGPLPEQRRTRLHQELSKRLPAVKFEFVDDGPPSGLAQNDFNNLRAAVSSGEPDLVLWQVGAPDALAMADPEEFGRTLKDAADWLKARNVDFILIDPPFAPSVRHEKLYWRIVGKIREVSDRAGLNLFRRYAAMQYLEFERQKLREEPADAGSRRVCMSELVAEAIVRAVTR
jgi:hypothetical protein